jgi:hypothetical protein
MELKFQWPKPFFKKTGVMKNKIDSSTLISDYLSLFNFWSTKQKLIFIEKLQRSLNQSKTKGSRRFYNSFGAWVSEDTAEELTQTIRESRTINRSLEGF